MRASSGAGPSAEREPPRRRAGVGAEFGARGGSERGPDERHETTSGVGARNARSVTPHCAHLPTRPTPKFELGRETPGSTLSSTRLGDPSLPRVSFRAQCSPCRSSTQPEPPSSVRSLTSNLGSPLVARRASRSSDGSYIDAVRPRTARFRFSLGNRYERHQLCSHSHPVRGDEAPPRPLCSSLCSPLGAGRHTASFSQTCPSFFLLVLSFLFTFFFPQFFLCFLSSSGLTAADRIHVERVSEYIDQHVGRSTTMRIIDVSRWNCKLAHCRSCCRPSQRPSEIDRPEVFITTMNYSKRCCEPVTYWT